MKLDSAIYLFLYYFLLRMRSSQEDYYQKAYYSFQDGQGGVQPGSQRTMMLPQMAQYPKTVQKPVKENNQKPIQKRKPAILERFHSLLKSCVAECMLLIRHARIRQPKWVGGNQSSHGKLGAQEKQRRGSNGKLLFNEGIYWDVH